MSRPKDETGREIISVKGILEWAFATECATLDFSEIDALVGCYYSSTGAEYRIMQQLALGKKRGEGVRPDTSFGRSWPHDDAELVATVLRNAVHFGLAVRVAELARTCRVPQWDLGSQRLQPRTWCKPNQYGAMGKTEICRTVEYQWRGRKRVRRDMWVPCVWVPSASQIAAARRAYLGWWGALQYVRCDLQNVSLTRFVVSDRMPPMMPWQKSS